MNSVLLMGMMTLAVMPGSEHYAAGWRAESQGRGGDAVQAYTAAAETDGPLKYYALARSAAARGRAGDIPGATAQLTEMLQSAPSGAWTPFALYELAVLRARANQQREASLAYIAALDTDNPLWWLDEYRKVAAQTHLESADSARYGFDYYRNVVRTTRFIAPRAYAAQQLARSADATDLFVATDGLIRGREPNSARELVSRIKGRNFDDDKTRALVALMSVRLDIAENRLNGAEDTLTGIDSRDDLRTELAEVHLELIRAYCSANRFPQAEFAATRMAENFPEAQALLGEASWRIGEAYARTENHMNAITKFGDLIRRYPDHDRVAAAWYQIGLAQAARNNLASALEALDRTIERYPGSDVAADAGNTAGEMLEKAGDKPGAILRYEKAAEVGLGTYTGHRAQAHLNLLEGRTGATMPHDVPGAKRLTSPIAGIDRVRPRPDAMADDERIQRLRFFASYGMPEAEWEVLGLADTLTKGSNPGPLYETIAQAGTAYSAMQIADAQNWGVDENGVRTTERQRVRFPLAYWPIVSDLAAETGVDPYLILSVARQESTYRPALTSYAGARGVMQVMPTTADWLAKVEDAIPSSVPDELENPHASLRLGAYYLQRMIERSNGNVVYALASYNAGPGNCDKWRRRHGDISAEAFVEKIPFRETKHYVENVMGYYAAYHSLYERHEIE